MTSPPGPRSSLIRGVAALGCTVAVIGVLGGCGRVGFDDQEPRALPVLTFVDEDQASFDRGNYEVGTRALIWRDGRIQLAGMQPFLSSEIGVYVSRPFDAGNDAAIWDTLAWLPAAPYGKALPGNGATEVGYEEGGAVMAENLVLLHLDGAGETAHGDVVLDSSGRDHHGTIVLAGQGVRHLPGRFGQALDIDRDAWAVLDGDYFDLGTGDFSYAVWTQMHPCSESNDNRVAMGGAGMGDTPHMWIGVRCPDNCTNGDLASTIFLDSTRAGPWVSTCTGVRMDDGGWHHITAVKEGHTAPGAILRLYVDGREVSNQPYDFGAATFTYDGGEIRLGGFNLGGTQYNTRVIVDEAVAWRRALGPDEIRGLYRRGALALGLQVRICDDGVCDDEVFVGPDGTSASYFTDAELDGFPGDLRGNLAGLGLVGRVLQYRVRFATEDAGASPGLKMVTVGVQP